MASPLFPAFSGRIFQVTEALDFGDAVSNQVMALDRMLAGMGFETAIHCKWFFESMNAFCKPLEALQPNEDDIVVLHFSGYSEFALPWVEGLYCTKVCVYHNITPHQFFEPSTDIYALCLRGRQQVPRIVSGFHHFWGDSQFNLDELIESGAPRERCHVIPIVVPPRRGELRDPVTREAGTWMFLGRVAANKRQADLVRLFARMHAQHPALATRLYIVGGIHESDPYARQLRATIAETGLKNEVVVTGKLSDEEVERHLARASMYVSLSEHEGFGVPLVEAARRGLAVFALRNTAVGETLGGHAGLANTPDELADLLERTMSDPQQLADLKRAQKDNAQRFTRPAVEARLVAALRTLLPSNRAMNFVSIVICTYNRAELLERCLDYLQYQTVQNFEVIVVNGPSTDGTEAVLERYRDRIKVGRNPEANLSKSRNLGIELADGDLIAFIDDDALPFDDWVATLLDEFNRRPSTLGALGGPVYYAGTLDWQTQDIGFNKLAEARINIPSSEIGRDGWVRSLLGTNTCFRAEALRAVAGFDEQFDYFLDESELCFRMQARGWLVGYCPELYLRHEFAQSSNRAGAYKYNWYAICKNTAYFVAAYSGLKGEALSTYVERRMQKERIKPLDAAVASGDLASDERDRHVEKIRAGAAQGLEDSRAFPRTRRLQPPPGRRLAYTFASSTPLVGRDMRRLHVCVVTKEFPPFRGMGGIGTLYYHLVTELLQMGHYITVVLPGERDDQYQRGRFQIKYVGQREVCEGGGDMPGFGANLGWSLSALAAVAAVNEERPVDVVDSALWDAEALALALLPHSDRPPLVVRLVTPFATALKHNGWAVGDREREFFMRAERTVIERADAVLPISWAIADTVEHEHGLQRDARWVLAQCGIAYWPSFDSGRDYKAFTTVNGKPFDLPAKARIVLFIGRLERRKGIDTLVEAARRFLAADPNAWLVIAGRDIEGWTQRLHGELGDSLAQRARVFGEVDTATREKLLHAAHCVVFPSRYESFGLVPLEAFVHGTPVVGARAGAIPEVIDDGGAGLLFDVDSPQALADCVIRLLRDEALHDQLAKGAHQRIRAFSSRRSAVQAVELYRGLTAARFRRNHVQVNKQS